MRRYERVHHEHGHRRIRSTVLYDYIPLNLVDMNAQAVKFVGADHCLLHLRKLCLRKDGLLNDMQTLRMRGYLRPTIYQMRMFDAEQYI